MLGAGIEVVRFAYCQSNGLEHMSKCMPELIQHNGGAGFLVEASSFPYSIYFFIFSNVLLRAFTPQI